MLHAQGKYEDAEREQRRAKAVWEATLGPTHPTVAKAHGNLASILQAQNDYEPAETEHRRGLAMLVDAVGAEHPDVAAAHINLANTLQAQGNYEVAEIEHRRGLAALQAAMGLEHPDVAIAHNNLASVLAAQGERVGARARPGKRRRRRAPPAQPRELEIAELVVEGLTNPDIAEELGISQRTVTTHLANMYRRLDIHSRAALTRVMMEHRVSGRR